MLIIAAIVAGLALLTWRPERAVDRSPGRIVVIRSGDREETTVRAGRPVLAVAEPMSAKPPSGDDRAWARSSESVLRTQLRQVPMLDVGDNLRISCAIRRCLATARLPAGLEGENRAMYWRFIQGPAVQERMAELGLPLDEARLGPDDRFVLGFVKGS